MKGKHPILDQWKSELKVQLVGMLLFGAGVIAPLPDVFKIMLILAGLGIFALATWSPF